MRLQNAHWRPLEVVAPHLDKCLQGGQDIAAAVRQLRSWPGYKDAETTDVCKVFARLVRWSVARLLPISLHRSDALQCAGRGCGRRPGDERRFPSRRRGSHRVLRDDSGDRQASARRRSPRPHVHRSQWPRPAHLRCVKPERRAGGTNSQCARALRRPRQGHRPGLRPGVRPGR